MTHKALHLLLSGISFSKYFCCILLYNKSVVFGHNRNLYNSLRHGISHFTFDVEKL